MEIKIKRQGKKERASAIKERNKEQERQQASVNNKVTTR